MPFIHDFIESQWTAARVELEALDPAFVAAKDASVGLSAAGLYVPEVKPTTRLNQRWHEFLETLVDIALQIEHLEQCVVGLSDDLPETPEESAAQLYHQANWQHHAYALFEKTEVAIKRRARLAPGEHRPRANEIADRYVDLFHSSVSSKLVPYRTPSAHGVGGVGLSARGITEIELWEDAVVLPIPAEKIIEHLHESRTDGGLGGYKTAIKDTTESVLTSIGGLLGMFSAEIDSVDRPHNSAG